ncbi:hypothetical protein BJ546DRAFT_360711 [Cryomyces antarcticus]
MPLVHLAASRTRNRRQQTCSTAHSTPPLQRRSWRHETSGPAPPSVTAFPSSLSVLLCSALPPPLSLFLYFPSPVPPLPHHPSPGSSPCPVLPSSATATCVPRLLPTVPRGSRPAAKQPAPTVLHTGSTLLSVRLPCSGECVFMPRHPARQGKARRGKTRHGVRDSPAASPRLLCSEEAVGGSTPTSATSTVRTFHRIARALAERKNDFGTRTRCEPGGLHELHGRPF